MKNQLEEILRAVKNKELDPLDAFFEVRQLVMRDESTDNTEILLKKRFQFWGFELKSLDFISLPPKERLQYLRDYFFEKKARLIKDSIAPHLLMGLALQNFANLTGISLSFVQLGKHLALKTEIEGEFHYISLDENGRLLDTQEVLDLIFNFGKIRRIEFSDLLIAYFEFVQKKLDPKRASKQVLRIYDLILSLRSSDPKTLLRRAYLYRELGYLSEALTDLKRYIHFQPSESFSKSLKRFIMKLSDDQNNDTHKS